jgi:hypothetical protein
LRDLVAELLKNKYVGFTDELCRLLLADDHMNRWAAEVKQGKQRLRHQGDDVWLQLLEDVETAHTDLRRAIDEFVAAGPRYTSAVLEDRRAKLRTVIVDSTERLEAIPRRYGAD